MTDKKLLQPVELQEVHDKDSVPPGCLNRPLHDIGYGLVSLAIILESEDGEYPYPGWQFHWDKDKGEFQAYTCEFHPPGEDSGE